MNNLSSLSSAATQPVSISLVLSLFLKIVLCHSFLHPCLHSSCLLQLLSFEGRDASNSVVINQRKLLHFKICHLYDTLCMFHYILSQEENVSLDVSIKPTLQSSYRKFTVTGLFYHFQGVGKIMAYCMYRINYTLGDDQPP